MPTYKRETYVNRNMRVLSEDVMLRSKNRIKLFVVDNGQTLRKTALAGVSIIPNLNYGGAGGFARGVLAAMNDPESFTHVLFCDDDVLIEPESVQRLYALLSYVDDKTIVGGGMLNMREKNRMHEAGAYAYVTKIYPRKHLLDVCEVARLIDYDKPEVANYFAWWFFAAPLEAFSNHGMPMPFFLLADDIELGIRLYKAGWKMTTLLGSAIWHDEHDLKNVPYRDYYVTRNMLITAWLHADELKPTKTVMAVFRLTVKSLLTYRYDRAEFLIEGAQDALKGPSFLTNVNAAEYHIRLVRNQTAIMQPVEYVSEKYNRKISRTLFIRLAILLTLNGHLLPKFLMHKDTNAFEPGWAFEELHSYRLRAIFRCPTVLYYEPISHQGIIYHIKRKRFFSLLFRLIGTSAKLYFMHGTMIKQWRRAFPTLITPKFWTKYLGLQER